MHGKFARLFLASLAFGVSATLLFTDGAPTASANTVVTITGRAVYEVGEGDLVGIDGAKINICDDDGLLGRQCVETTSNSNGNFSGTLSDTFEPDDAGLEIYVEVIADSPGVVVTPADILNPFAYCYRTATSSVEDGETKSFGEQTPLTNNSCSPISLPHTDQRENDAFYVFTQLQRAWQYMSGVTQSINGSAVPKVSANLIDANGADPNAVSFYAVGNITVQPYTWDPDNTFGYETLFHEYGHHVLSNFAESPFPDYVNDNCDDVNQVLFFEIHDPGHCQWLPEKNVIAWTEGFPTFLAYVLDKEIYGNGRLSERVSIATYDSVNYWEQGLETPAMRNSAKDGSEVFGLSNDTGVFEDHPDDDYEHIEGWTSAVLWDIYDTAADDHDRDGTVERFSMPFSDIWNVISNYDPAPSDDAHDHPLSLEELYDGILDLYSTTSVAELAGPFIENHFDVPAAALTLNTFSSFANWLSTEKYNRGDVLSADYEVCRPSSSDVDWDGRAEVGVTLFNPTTGAKLLEFPPLSLPDLAAGECADGLYEFVVPENLSLVGPQYLFGSLNDNHYVYDGALCVDPRQLLAESFEADNCRPPHTLRLQNASPVIVTNATSEGFVVDEGSELVIDLSGSYDPDPIPGQGLEYKVNGAGGDLDTGIGFVDTPTITFRPEDAPFLSDGADPATEDEVFLQIRDDGPPEFSSHQIARIPLKVNNVAPNTFITNTPSAGQFLVFEGSPVTIQGQFFDPGADSWEVMSYFGDEAEATEGVITQTHFETSIIPNGYYGFWEITKTFTDETSSKGIDFFVCVTDDDGGEGCTPIGQAQVVVFNVAPEVDLPASITFDEGSDVTIDGSFSDPGEDTWTATASIDGGAPFAIDVSADKTFSVSTGFTQEGTHTVEVCVNDGRDTDCGTTSVEILNVAPQFELDSPVAIDEGDTLSVSGAFTDPGDDTWTATVSFDGAAATPLAIVGKTFTVERGYPQDGSFSIEICINDGDATTCRAAIIDVANVAPAFDLQGPLTINEGDSVSLVEPFTDPGADTWQATVAYDGGFPEPLLLDGQAFSIERTYVEDGAYSVTVCVADDDTETCDTVSIDVLNVAPAVTLQSVPDQFVTLAEDSVSATFNDPGIVDTHTSMIDWGDGTSELLVIAPDATATGAVASTHTYTTAGQYTIEVCATDDDGATGCASTLIDVLDPASALNQAIANLQEAAGENPEVADALKDLEGANSKSSGGALDKIEAGNYVAALTRLSKAVDSLAESDGDYASDQLFLALIGESVARNLLSQVEALGITDPTSLSKIEEMRSLIDEGRAALEAGAYTESLQAFKSAVQIGMSLL